MKSAIGLSDEHVLFLSCSFASDEIKFCLMALVSDRKMAYEKEIAERERRKEQAAQRVSEPRRDSFEP